MKNLALSLIVAGSVVSMPAIADLPDKEYACKVQTVTLKLGAVLVQAWDMNSAREIAAVSPAVRIEDRAVEPAQMVLECVQFPGDEFSESEFQSFVESLPR